MDIAPHTTLSGYRNQLDLSMTRRTECRSNYTSLSHSERYEFDEERVAWFRAGFHVGSTAVNDFIRDIKRSLIGWDAGPRGKDLLILDGPAYVGKTTALLAAGREIEKSVYRFRPAYRSEGEVPVVHVEMTARANDKSVFESILAFFGVPYDRYAKAERLMAQAVEILRLRRTRLLIIDELQMVHLQGKSGDDAVNAVKSIHNQSQCLPVLAGIELSNLLIRPAADQLMSRGRIHDMRPYTNASKNDREAWSMLLNAFAQQLPLLDGTPSLTNFADLLLLGTQGRVGRLRWTLEFLLTGFIQDRRDLEDTTGYETPDAVPERITAPLITEAVRRATDYVEALEASHTAIPNRRRRRPSAAA